MKFEEIKKGEVLSSTMYLTVADKTANAIKVKDSVGQEFEVRGPKLIESTMNSGTQYATEKKVTRTELATALTNAGDSVFTVVFYKQDGTERTLVGKLLDTENHMGRSNALDLQITSGNAMRQVDHRTLKSLILRDIKYTVKK